jgi:predicted metalloprotease
MFLGPAVLGMLLNAVSPEDDPPYPPEPTSTGVSDPTITIPAPTGLPPLPDPQTRQQQQAYIFDNTLYTQVLSESITCEVTTDDLSKLPVTEMQAYLNRFVNCLMEAWSGPVTAAGFELPRPNVTVYDQPITTKCGKAPTENAFYCGADQQMYFSADLIRLFPSLRGTRYMTEAILAHEFGHAVQARTGILLSEYRYEDEAATTAEADQWSRRTELQADCFAGLSLHSMAAATGMTDAETQAITHLFTLLGDDEPSGDHGQGSSRVRWISAGLGSNTPGQCHAFSAPDSEVE